MDKTRQEWPHDCPFRVPWAINGTRRMTKMILIKNNARTWWYITTLCCLGEIVGCMIWRDRDAFARFVQAIMLQQHAIYLTLIVDTLF